MKNPKIIETTAAVVVSLIVSGAAFAKSNANGFYKWREYEKQATQIFFCHETGEYAFVK